MTSNEIKSKWQKEYWLLHVLMVIPYKLPFNPETEPAVLDAWREGGKN